MDTVLLQNNNRCLKVRVAKLMLVEKDVEREEAKTGCSNRTWFLLTLTGTSEKNYPGKWWAVHVSK